MRLTPEQLAELRFALEATIHSPCLSVEAAHDLFDHIDAQQARIAELEKKHLAERHAYLQERAKCEQLEARIADLELALFAENQKRQEVAQQRGQLLSALELVLCDTEEAEHMTGRELTENARAVIAAVRGETLCTPTSPS